MLQVDRWIFRVVAVMIQHTAPAGCAGSVGSEQGRQPDRCRTGEEDRKEGAEQGAEFEQLAAVEEHMQGVLSVVEPQQ